MRCDLRLLISWLFVILWCLYCLILLFARLVALVTLVVLFYVLVGDGIWRLFCLVFVVWAGCFVGCYLVLFGIACRFDLICLLVFGLPYL